MTSESLEWRSHLFLTLRCHLITLSFYFVAPAVARRSLLSAVIAASRFFPSSTMKQIKSLSRRHAWKWKWSRSVVSDSLRPRELKPTRLLRPWDFPGKNTGVGCHCLLRNHPIVLLKQNVSGGQGLLHMPYNHSAPTLSFPARLKHQRQRRLSELLD